MNGLDRIRTVLCTSSQCESEDDLLSLINSARSVARPTELGNEDVYISDTNTEDYNLVYSTGEPERPSGLEDNTAIVSNVINDNRFHVHSVIEQEHFDQVITTHQQMLTSAGKIDIGYIGIVFEIDSPLSEVVHGIDFIQLDESTPRIDGINFVQEELDINITNHPIETLLSVVEPDVETIEASMIQERVDETAKRAEEHLEKILQ